MFLYILVLACVYLTYRNKKYYNNFQRIKKSIEETIPHLRLMKSHIAILMDRLNEIHQILEKQLGDEENLSNEEMRSLRRKFSNLKEKVNNIQADEENLSNEEMRSLRRKFSNLKEKVNNIQAENIPAKIIN